MKEFFEMGIKVDFRCNLNNSAAGEKKLIVVIGSDARGSIFTQRNF